jgi:hypothetical protein
LLSGKPLSRVARLKPHCESSTSTGSVPPRTSADPASVVFAVTSSVAAGRRRQRPTGTARPFRLPEVEAEAQRPRGAQATGISWWGEAARRDAVWSAGRHAG